MTWSFYPLSIPPVLGLLALVAACSYPGMPEWTAIPVTATELVQPATPQVLFQDDFSDTSSGWEKLSDVEGITDYANGSYQIKVNSPNWHLWSTPGKSFTDVIIWVEATNGSGIEESDFGILCRYQDDQNFYKFTLSSDGYYGISKVINGQEQLVGMDTLQRQNSPFPSGQVIAIQAACTGESLALWVNGTKLTEVSDAELGSGDIGLIAGTFDTPGAEIWFDNLKVSSP